ncbi:MAG: N,N-dimethylformamidase beta subunit family domain-containing protein [Armatimonadota bacterium]
MGGDRPVNRRRVLKGALATGFAAAVPRLASAAPEPRRRPELIREENARQGTRDWLLTRTGIDPKTRYRCPWIEGYCSRASVAAGETLEIMVSANPASPFRIDVYRLGYYGGTGARHLETLGPFKGEPQPDPPEGEGRLRECAWEPAVRLRIPEEWPSGVYLGKLTAEREGWQSYVIWIVRDHRPADFLFQCSTNTWHAYNRWPSQFSLYDDGKKEWYWGPDVRISYDRPYGKYCQIFDAPLSTGSGEFLLWEFPLAYWMEQQGYDVSYITNVETHAEPETLLRGRAFLSVGHDEYWSREMYRNVKRALDAGVHGGFLCGNSVYGITPMSPSSKGVPHRTLTRTGIFGPMDPRYVPGWPEMERFTENGPNEALLMGARSVWPTTGGGPWVCSKEDHWLFEGTGMKNGDGIPGLVGWEFHGAPAELPGLEVVSTGKTSGGREDGTYTSVLFPGAKGNLIFNAATIWWGDGLSEPPGYVRPKVYTEPKGPDPRVQRITRNLFERFRG